MRSCPPPIALVAFALVTLGACEQKAPEAPAPKKAEAGQAPQPNPDRNAYFGETHIHTSWSVDAWVFGNHLTGRGDALKYAQGQTIKHPLGYDIRIETPLDFMGVTDHSEASG